jgi:uncharacterized membrane protein YuzA (DUF378 family)
MPMLNVSALLLTIIGGVNWLLVGVANTDLVATIFGPGSTLARTVYVVVGISALYCLSFIPHVTHERDVIPTNR